MKKVLLTLLVMVVIVLGLGAAGFAGYRYGYAQALQTTSNGNPPRMPQDFGFDPNKMPMHGRGFDHRAEMMPRGRMGFGMFGPVLFLAQLAFWIFVIWAVYTLVVRSGWRLTRTTQPAETQAKE